MSPRQMAYGEYVVPFDLGALARRVGEDVLRRRLMTQAEHTADGPGQGRGILRMESKVNVYALFEKGLRMTGLFERGRRNFLSVRLRENRLAIPHLPEAFEGYRVLQIADLHADIEPGLAECLAGLLDGLEYDLCVNTGDYRNGTYADFSAGIYQCSRIFEHIRQPHYGILGNHDFIEMVPSLEKLGLRLLLNENVAIERDGQRLWLVGVDDPHYYQTADFGKAFEGIPHQAATLLLAHAPECYRKAADHGAGAMLSGHTHGGQVCLPGGFALLNNGHVPRKGIKGTWKWKQMSVYVSPGTGGCGTAVRFFCPPELTLHTLVRA